MAIKLEIYLKRTGQTLESWLDANRITKPEELLPTCAFIGLAASPSDVALVSEVFRRRKQAAAVPVKPVEKEPEQQAEAKSKPKKKVGPAAIDTPPDQSDPS